MPPVAVAFVGLITLVFCLRSKNGAKESKKFRFVVVELAFDVTPYSHSAMAAASAETHSIEQHGQQSEHQIKGAETLTGRDVGIELYIMGSSISGSH